MNNLFDCCFFFLRSYTKEIEHPLFTTTTKNRNINHAKATVWRAIFGSNER